MINRESQDRRLDPSLSFPGAIGGGVVGGIFGAAAGTLTSAAAEPFFRMYHNWSTYHPALNRIAIDCDAEARTTVNSAVLRGTP